MFVDYVCVLSCMSFLFGLVCVFVFFFLFFLCVNGFVCVFVYLPDCFLCMCVCLFVCLFDLVCFVVCLVCLFCLCVGLLSCFVRFRLVLIDFVQSC